MNIIESLGSYKSLCRSIIRPPRQSYHYSSLGPRSFLVGGKRVFRNDFRLINSRGFKIECSLFKPQVEKGTKLPWVIYLHGNWSSRLEALTVMPSLIGRNIQLCCLDFSGCGLSEGDYISLGYFERNDLERVIEYLQYYENISCINIWGRSMGASTCLMTEKINSSVNCIVMDGPFKSLKSVCEYRAKEDLGIPNVITQTMLKLVRKTIKSTANFDIYDLKPYVNAKNYDVPAYFIAAKDDSMIPLEHIQEIYQNYNGKKQFSLVEGDHNSVRSELVINTLANFIKMNSPQETCAISPGRPFAFNCKPFKIQKPGHEQNRLSSHGDYDEIPGEREGQEYLITTGDMDDVPEEKY